MNFDQALAYLLSLGHETLTIKLGLENTETLLAALGNPQRNYQSVQIAGTNGKGSTAAFLDSICRAAGIRTGLFTSPHLISITERIKVDGKPIFETQFARLTGVVKAVAEQLVARGELQTLPTFFEHVTAIALLAFARARVDLAILETGLGGRLDSTTAVRAGIVAITSIAMDHEEYLGHTLAEIAAEKAAIIQPGATAIVAPQQAEALDVVIRRCESVGVQPRLIAPTGELSAQGDCHSTISAITADGRATVWFKTRAAVYDRVTLALRGLHQVENAAAAIAIAEALNERGFRICHADIVQGIETTNHPGRLELWENAPRFLFDGAHNPAGVQALRRYLDQFIRRPATFVFSAMRDKDLKPMLDTLFTAGDRLILTEADSPRAAPVALLKGMTGRWDSSRISVASNTEQALNEAVRITSKEDVICITGSLYLVGESFSLLNKLLTEQSTITQLEN